MKFESQLFISNHLFARFVVIAGVLLFAPYALLTIGSKLFSQIPLAFASIVGLWQFFLSWFLLSQPEVYVLLCTSFILLSLLGLFFGRSSPKQGAVCLLVLALVCFFAFAPYRPAVKAAEGYRMIVPTAPSFFMRGLRNAQAIAEVTPCEYRLLGWQHETLFYQSTCGNTSLRTWQFSPDTMQQPIEHLGSPIQNLYANPTSHAATLAQVIAQDVYPPEAEHSVRVLYVARSGLLSPGGEWLALIAQRVYSTQDVIVVTTD
jgi:hypothetical protein